MIDTQDVFVDEVRVNVNLGSYSVGAVEIAIRTEIRATWNARGDWKTNLYIRSLIRALRDIKKVIAVDFL